MSEVLVQAVLRHWPVTARKVSLVAERENSVYRVIADDDSTYALRLHRRGYRSDAELVSELDWMTALAQGGLEVPTPVRSRAGRFFEIVEGRQSDLLTWCSGTQLGRSGEPLACAERYKTFFGLGAALARLHAISDAWTSPEGFTRPNWDLEGLLGEQPLWGRFWDNHALSSEERRLLMRARDKARLQLSTLAPDLDYGLIHADAVRENVLVDAGKVRLIDFDDCGWGFRLFDVATALLKNEAEFDYPDLEASLLDGYAGVRTLHTQHLSLFLMLRAFTYVGWIMPRLGEAGAERRNARNIASALKRARDFL